LYQLGLISQYLNFFSDPFVLLNAIVVVYIYRMIPFAALILLAALQSIPLDLHEAAKVDGASTWQRFRGVTLPLLKPALTIAIVIPSVFGFRVFDELYVIAGVVNTDTRTLMLLSYITNFVALDFGYGSALTWIMTLIAMVFSYFYIKTMYKRIV
jgi:ABC-type sugar transport system permease subunit